MAQIADILARAHVIRWRAGFIAMAEFTGAAHRLKAGEYVFPGGSPLGRVIETIAHGRVVRRAVTIPEGLTSKAAAAIIDAAPALVGDTPVAPEGALLPDTYDVKLGETRADVVNRMRAARDALLARLWAGRAPGLPYANPEQAVTLASIVEKETAKPSERPRIAAIFVHRLQKGMRLESDPTTIYGLTGGVPLGHGLRVSELASHDAVQHLQDHRPAADADRQPWPRLAGSRAAPGCRAATSTSSPTAPAVTSSPTPTPTTCAMSPNGGRSRPRGRPERGDEGPSILPCPPPPLCG